MRISGKWAAASALGGLAFGTCASLNAPVALVSLGLCFGVPQAVAMRHDVRAAWLWAVATAVAMLPAWMLGIVTVLVFAALEQSIWPSGTAPGVLAVVFGVLAYGAAMLIAGGVVGLAQSGLLPDASRWRRRWVVWTGVGALSFWVLVTGALVVFGGGWTATNALLGGSLQVPTVPLFVAGGALGGLAYGLITAPTLRRITGGLS